MEKQVEIPATEVTDYSKLTKDNLVQLLKQKDEAEAKSESINNKVKQNLTDHIAELEQGIKNANIFTNNLVKYYTTKEAATNKILSGMQELSALDQFNMKGE